MAIDCKGLVWSWGTNNFGELGVGDNDPRVHPYPILALKGKTVNSITCGGQFVIALGRNLKKEIPELRFKTELEKAYSSNNYQSQESRSHGKKKSKSKHKK